jgi:isopentenyl phosphate kinase
VANRTRNPSEVTDHLFNTLKQAHSQLGFADLLYGDVSRVLGTPSICVESGPTNIETAASRLKHTFTTYVIVYHGKYQDKHDNRKELDLYAEKVRDVLQTDTTFGGLVNFAWVSTMEPGWGVREKSLWNMHRLTVTSLSQSNNDVNFGGL